MGRFELKGRCLQDSPQVGEAVRRRSSQAKQKAEEETGVTLMAAVALAQAARQTGAPCGKTYEKGVLEKEEKGSAVETGAVGVLIAR